LKNAFRILQLCLSGGEGELRDESGDHDDGSKGGRNLAEKITGSSDSESLNRTQTGNTAGKTASAFRALQQNRPYKQNRGEQTDNYKKDMHFQPLY